MALTALFADQIEDLFCVLVIHPGGWFVNAEQRRVLMACRMAIRHCWLVDRLNVDSGLSRELRSRSRPAPRKVRRRAGSRGSEAAGGQQLFEQCPAAEPHFWLSTSG